MDSAPTGSSDLQQQYAAMQSLYAQQQQQQQQQQGPQQQQAYSNMVCPLSLSTDCPASDGRSILNEDLILTDKNTHTRHNTLQCNQCQ
jgi:hypothetical protein